MARLEGEDLHAIALSAFHASTGTITNRDRNAVPGGAETKQEMARLEGEDLNALFETLADWNVQLKDVEEFIYSDEPGGPQP